MAIVAAIGVVWLTGSVLLGVLFGKCIAEGARHGRSADPLKPAVATPDPAATPAPAHEGATLPPAPTTAGVLVSSPV